MPTPPEPAGASLRLRAGESLLQSLERSGREKPSRKPQVRQRVFIIIMENKHNQKWRTACPHKSALKATRLTPKSGNVLN